MLVLITNNGSFSVPQVSCENLNFSHAYAFPPILFLSCTPSLWVLSITRVAPNIAKRLNQNKPTKKPTKIIFFIVSVFGQIVFIIHSDSPPLHLFSFIEEYNIISTFQSSSPFFVSQTNVLSSTPFIFPLSFSITPLVFFICCLIFLY